MKTQTSLAQSILIQADGDLSDRQFRSYIRLLAEKELSGANPLPPSVTIEQAISALWAVKEECDSLESDYEIGKNDPACGVIGFHPADPAEELIRSTCEAESTTRDLIRIGLHLDSLKPA